MNLLIVAAALAASTMPAQSPEDLPGAPFPGINGAIQRIYVQADAQCRRMGLRLHTTMDTVFGVEDIDGRGTTGFVVGPLTCDNAAHYGDDPTRSEDLYCRGDVCRQWVVVGERRRARVVWSGYRSFSGISGESLQEMVGGCVDPTGSLERCPHAYWNGTTFSRQRPARAMARRHRHRR